MKFSAVILAGGKSSRMGRDKAALQIRGRSLLEHQLELVRQIQPAEVFVSAGAGRRDVASNCKVLCDSFAGQGPLAGIEAALAAMNSPMLLVLAVDLPRMRQATLRWLVEQVSGTLGVVPRVNEAIEPLVAVYPKAAHEWVREALESGRNAAHEFARKCVSAGGARWVEVPVERLPDFTNYNSPEEWAAMAQND